MKKARLKLKLTQKEVAKQLGISTNHYAILERTGEGASLKLLKSVSDVLGINLHKLI